MAKVSVIIVTWNAEKFIRNCLDSVFRQTVKDLEIIVYDNGSSDSTREILSEYRERILLLSGEENKGFCWANNRALEKADGDFILTLNSDIVLNDKYLEELLDFLRDSPRTGMVQGKFLRMDNHTIDGLGLKLSPLLRLFNVREGEASVSAVERPEVIFGPCAAAAIYRRELVRDISVDGEFFDENFFFLVEDFDVAWRARNRGWEAMYVPRAVCRHFRESSAHRSEFRQYLSLRNRYYLIIKNADFSFFFTLKLLAVLLFYDLPRMFYVLLRNRQGIKVFRDLKRSYPDLMRKRRVAKTGRTA